MKKTSGGDGIPVELFQILKDELPRSVGAQYAAGEITPERMKRWSQSKNNTQLWMWLVIEVKFDAVKSNIS